MSKLQIAVTKDDARVLAMLDAKQAAIMPVMVAKMTFLMKRLEDRVKTSKLSGQVLKSETGALRDSVRAQEAETNGQAIIGQVFYGGASAPYAAIHEFGGRKMYAINPKRGPRILPSGKMGRPFLKFYWEKVGKIVFLPYVFHPPLQRRSFMNVTLVEMQAEIIRGLREAFVGVMKG